MTIIDMGIKKLARIDLVKGVIATSAALFIISVPIFAIAVSGYKDINFNITSAQLVKLKKCTIGKTPTKANGITIYSCSDFSFNNKKVAANFYFIEDKLLRIGLMAGASADDAIVLAKSLREKYGEPSHHNPNELDNFDQHKSDSADIAWDNDTVILRIFREGAASGVLLMYSSKAFEDSVLRVRSDGLGKDL